MELDRDLKLQAMERAKEIYENIYDASHNPESRIAGEALRVYQELEMWGWFERYPIEDEDNRWMYITMIAQTQYRHLRWKRDHPEHEKKKLSKWEKVTGKMMN